MDFPILDIEFTKDGDVFAPAQEEVAMDAAANADDVIVIVHGWNNDMDDARRLYVSFFDHMRMLLDSEDFADLRGRRFVALQVFWPSKRFAERDLIPGGGAVALGEDDKQAQVEALLDELAVEPQLLGGHEINLERKQKIDEAKHALPDAGITREATQAFVDALRSAFPKDDAELDDGSAEIYEIAPWRLFEDLNAPVLAPLPVYQGGAVAMAGEGAVGIGDLMSGPLAAARRIGNFFTYYEMKARAGKVGRLGLAPLVKTIKTDHPEKRVHLVGHSFGGRLVTAAATVLATGTSGISLTLLQAALSHNALATDFDKHGHDGAFHELLSANRHAAGPIVITHTKNDRAVGVAYPLASRFARDKTSALGDHNDPYGGMGRNGAQHLDAVHEAELDTSSRRLRFPRDAVTNLLVDRVVANHGDVANRFVVGAVLDVMRA